MLFSAKEHQKNDCCSSQANPRLGKVGGQAVLEGVMMKAGSHVVTTCRKEDGTLVVTTAEHTSVRKKHKILNLPIIRGVVNFIETLKLSMTTLEASADALGLEEEEETKFEKWLKKHFGANLVGFVMVLGTVLGLALSVALFIFLPRFLVGTLLNKWILHNALDALPIVISLLEGVMKIAIFLAYLALVTLMPDIKRVFMYHGAEHKSIACFEANAELTPANAMHYTRFHPRCGTSFMFFMILIGILVGMVINTLIPGLNSFAYTGIRLLLLPLVVGVGYEFIMYAGKHQNIFTKILSAPGLWVQRLTTKEPTEDMLECAITSLKCALRDDFPEFKDFYEAKPWEPAPAAEPAQEAGAEAPNAEVETASEPADEAL